jgi:hypothetical protein
MRKIILFFALLTINGGLLAQKNEPSKYAKKQAQKYTNELVEYISDVQAGQQQQLFQMNLQVSDRFDSLKKLELEKPDYKKAARAIMEWKDAEVKKIFNENQYDEYLMMKAEKFEEYKKKKKEFAAKKTEMLKLNDSIPEKVQVK